MKKIETFKSFSQLQNQIREESKLKEIEIKRGTTVSEFNSLLQKYNAASVADLNEEDRVAFMAELTKEGNAFGAARAEAIAKGDKEFEVDGEKVPVKNVDKEDEENAKEFVDESELSLKANPRLYTKVENKLKSQKYNRDAEYHLTLLKAMDPKKLSRSDLDTLSDFDDMYESVVTEAASDRIKVTYEEIRTIVDLANASIAAKKNNINGVFGYTLVSIFGDNMDKAESGPVTITVNPKAAGAILTLVDWADQDKSNVKNTAYAYGITSDDLRKKFAYGEIVESVVNEASVRPFVKKAGKVKIAWYELMAKVNAPEEKVLNVIAKVYSLAMEDANFHREMHTAKAIGSQSVSGIKANLQELSSEISRAAEWGGIYIAQGTLMYLRSIKQDAVADRFEKKINKEDDLHESTSFEYEVIEEGTRGQFGKIYKSGEIVSVYTHYDSYPENMLSKIKRSYKNGKDVDTILSKGDNSGLELDINNMNFYGDVRSMKPMTGKVKDIQKYVETADDQGAEYIYLFDERDSKWYMVEVSGDKKLVPAFESLVIEGEVDIQQEIDGELIQIYSKLNDLAEETTDPKWRKAIETMVKNIESIEDKIAQTAKKLGVVPTYEGNAFSTARLKAIEAGEKEFEFDGKTYPLTKVDAEDKEVAKDMVDERLDNATMKRMSGLTDNRDLRDFRMAFTSIAQDHSDEGFEFDETIEFLDTVMRDPNVKAQIKESVNEGNAFGTARLKAIEAGEDEFEFDGKTYPLTKVDAEDKEVAKDMVEESNKTIDASTFGDDKLRYNDQFRGATSLAKTLASELGFDPNKPWTEGIGFDDTEMYAIGKKEGTISRDALSGKYTYADILAMAKDFLGVNESEATDEVKEGNAFSTARLKAIEAGEKEFEFDGKTYPLTKVDAEDKEVAKDMVEEGAMSDIDLMAQNARDFKSFVKEFKKEYKNLYTGSVKELEAWLQSVYDSTNAHMAESTMEEGRSFIFAARKAKDEGLEEFEYNGKKYPVLLKEDEDLVSEGITSKQEKDIKSFIKGAEGKRVLLTTVEFDGTSKLEDIFKKSTNGLHKIDFMSFDFDAEIEALKGKNSGVIELTDSVFKWNIDGPRGSDFSIEIL